MVPGSNSTYPRISTFPRLFHVGYAKTKSIVLHPKVAFANLIVFEGNIMTKSVFA